MLQVQLLITLDVVIYFYDIADDVCQFHWDKSRARKQEVENK